MRVTVVSSRRRSVVARRRGTSGCLERAERAVLVGHSAFSRHHHCEMSDLHTPILRWYDEHARDLPWRAPGATPWAVMVSEFMLQQTPVSRVLPVFETWMT